MTYRLAGICRTLATILIIACGLGACSREAGGPEPAAPAAAPPPAAATPAAGRIDDERLNNAANEPENWLAHGGTQLAQRYSALDQINADNVSQLKPAWYLDFDTTRGQEATPIVVDGVAYVTTAWSKVYAVDAKTGEQLWYYDPKVPGEAAVKGCCDVVNRGAAVYQGKVYAGTYDGRLIALDAATGALVWSAQTTDPEAMFSITSAPRVARGLVFIGNGSSGEFGGRGYVSAYDAETGALAWRFYLTPGDPNVPDGAASDAIMASLVQPTWFGAHNDYRGGANVWNSMVYDPEFDQLYLATGNGFPWVRKFRSDDQGDNLFICSIVALDARTGEYRWHYQETPGDSWDYDSVADIILADLNIDGAPRKVLMHTPKNGFFYVLERGTGKLISAEPYVPGITWASHVDLASGRPVVADGAYYSDKPVRLSPGEGGGHSWQPTAFSPRTGLMYLQASANATTRYIPRPSYEYVKGMDYLGVYHFVQHGPDETPDPNEPVAPVPESYLLAFDPVAKHAAWTTEGRGAGVLATAGNLVFQGFSRNVVMGEIAAFRADDGTRVWSHETPNAIITGPVTYRIDGEQYLLFASGAGGGSIIAASPDVREPQVGRLVAFKLNGTATLPPDPLPARPLNPPAETWPADVVKQGEASYLEFCGRCHGLGTRSSNILPDLRRSPALASAELWSAIVEGGTLKERGMISWTHLMPAGAAEPIRAYVAEQARLGVQ